MHKASLLRVLPTDTEILVPELQITENTLERMRGLLGSQPLNESQGMLIEPCNSVHTFFMGYPLDVVYIDRQQRVCHRVESLKPWRCSAAFKAVAVVELAAGQIQQKNIQLGDQLQWQDG